MRRITQRGEGRIGAIITLVLLLAVGLAAWHVVPVYYDHYDFVDKINEICRTPRYKVRNGDDDIRKMLMDEVSRRGLSRWIGPESFEVMTTDHNRTIRLNYERETEVLPGYKKNFKFEFTADQPLI